MASKEKKNRQASFLPGKQTRCIGITPRSYLWFEHPGGNEYHMPVLRRTPRWATRTHRVPEGALFLVSFWSAGWARAGGGHRSVIGWGRAWRGFLGSASGRGWATLAMVAAAESRDLEKDTADRGLRPQVERERKGREGRTWRDTARRGCERTREQGSWVTHGASSVLGFTFSQHGSLV